jgi:hypothetical protein
MHHSKRMPLGKLKANALHAGTGQKRLAASATLSELSISHMHKHSYVADPGVSAKEDIGQWVVLNIELKVAVQNCN